MASENLKTVLLLIKAGRFHFLAAGFLFYLIGALYAINTGAPYAPGCIFHNNCYSTNSINCSIISDRNLLLEVLSPVNDKSLQEHRSYLTEIQNNCK
jgi:hypothetical protein